MRLPYHRVQGLFFPFCPGRTASVQVLKKTHTFQKPLVLYNCSKYVCPALKNYPTIDFSLDCAENGLQTIPRKIDEPGVLDSLPIRKINEIDEKCCKIGKNVITFSKKRSMRYDNERLKMYSGMLRECAAKGSLNEGKAIHGQLVVKGITPDSHLWVSLLNAYSKCRSPECARRVFDEMPDRDVVSWTTLISAFVASKRANDAIHLFREMKENGVKSNEFTLATVLKACCMSLDLYFGKQVHVEVIKLGAFSDVYVGSSLVDLYAKCGELNFAETVFLCMPDQNDVSWNILLNGYAQIGDTTKLLNLFCKITEIEMKFSKFTLSTVLKGCAISENLRLGQSLHSLAIRIGSELDVFMSCSLLDMYSKCGNVEDALKIFTKIKNPDIVTWSAMIACLDQQGKNLEAFKLFSRMIQTDVIPNQFTLSSIVSSASDLGDLNYGKIIHALIFKHGFELDNLVGNALITMYMKNRDLEKGCRVFKAMSDRDVVSWNAVLSGFHEIESCDQGPRFFYQMLLEGIKPNMYTFITILRSCSSLTNVEYGKQVHARVIKTSLDRDDFVATALIDMYSKSKCLELANIIFDKMMKKDVFTWTVMISGYARADQAEKGLEYFREMQREGVKPNEYTLASSLNCCSHLASLENGQQLHSMAIKKGNFDDLFVAGALVDMYGKCGSIEDAESIFEGLISRDTILWNTMICGYEKHGQGKKALEAFQKMIDRGFMPDEVTFIGVLSACSHMGLVQEGKGYFSKLSNIYGIIPTIDHYACMVDILTRAGKFDEVENFIDEMTITPTALIWETVLGACKLHGNLELGKIAAEKLYKLLPEADSTYILLSNIYASKNRWDDVKNIRAKMSKRGIKKEPGCSWVEVDGQVHVFLAQDSSHLMIKEIRVKLEDLSAKLDSAGYNAKTEHVLHNVVEREKRENLNYHSERLAFAYCLLSMNPRKIIRIYKNLRICGDCHDVMKLLSDITEREIIVRDIKRFHHFKNGTCSCTDYW